MNKRVNREFESTGMSARRIAMTVATMLSIVLVGVSDAGITRTGITRGRITAFGSIFVNRHEINVAGATISLDGQPGTEADLRVGQVVLVNWLTDDALPMDIASAVEFKDNVDGPITGINSGEGSLEVLGQPVLTDVDTVFDLLTASNKLSSLVIGDSVEVSGFLMADGSVVASRIAQKAMPVEHEVTGTVSDLTNTTFGINGLTVDYVGATLIGFSSIRDGDNVEAKGDALDASGQLIAMTVELQKEISGNTEDVVGEFEGFISDFDSSDSNFKVSGIEVATDKKTTYIGGGPANLAINTDVEVLGRFDKDGVLDADQVTIRGTRIRVHGLIGDLTDHSLTAVGVTADVNSSTVFQASASGSQGSLTLADLSPMDYVEIRSYPNPPASTPFLSQRVVRKDARTTIRLQGFVSQDPDKSFDIQGTPVFVGENTMFYAADGDTISEPDFFDALTKGTFVRVRGTYAAGYGVIANQVELGLDD